jgi:Asp-tRNA(Asn)/Glu-tRNA(Gln) amidotransferase B subunit
LPTTAAQLARLIAMVGDDSLSRSAAKKIFQAMAKSGDDADTIADRDGLRQVRDDDALERWVHDVWQENADEARRLVAGETKLLGVLVGLVMKKSGGRADPKKVNQLLRARASAT